MIVVHFSFNEEVSGLVKIFVKKKIMAICDYSMSSIMYALYVQVHSWDLDFYITLFLYSLEFYLNPTSVIFAIS